MMIPREQIRPNEWNANTFDPENYPKLVESIRDRGIMEPLKVMPDPCCAIARGGDGNTEDLRYLLIDGYHRWLAAEELGLMELPCEVWEISLEEAKIRGLQLNYLRGQPVPQRLAALLHDLNATFAVEDLANLLPWSAGEIEQAIDLLPWSAGEIEQAIDLLACDDDRLLVELLRERQATGTLASTGWDDEALREMMGRLDMLDEGLPADPGPGAVPAQAVTHPGDVWMMGRHRVAAATGKRRAELTEAVRIFSSEHSLPEEQVRIRAVVLIDQRQRKRDGFLWVPPKPTRYASLR
jgi:ParB-like chromosome segregation protein Spo0J